MSRFLHHYIAQLLTLEHKIKSNFKLHLIIGWNNCITYLGTTVHSKTIKTKVLMSIKENK